MEGAGKKDEMASIGTGCYMSCVRRCVRACPKRCTWHAAGYIMNTGLDAAACLSGETFSTHLASLPMRSYPTATPNPPHRILRGGGRQWSQHSHSPAESARLSPAFLSPFISFFLAPPGQEKKKKNSCYSLHGGGIRVCIL